MNNPFLTIIIPVYNVELYIEKCIKSVVDQDIFNEIELVIVNDGTKDNSIEIITPIIKDLPNVHLINKQNAGLSEARNSGLKIATGEYVWFVDSDDWLPENCLRRIKDFLLSINSEVFLFQMNIFHELNFHRLTFKDKESVNHLSGKELLSFIFSASEGYVPTQIYIVKRLFLLDKSLSFFPGIYHEDLEFCPRMLLSSKDISFIAYPIYCYRVRESGSITTDKSLYYKRKSDFLKIFKSLYSMPIERSEEFDKVLMITICGFFNDFSFEQWSEFLKMNDIKPILPSFRTVVRRNIKNANGLFHILRMLIFMLNPTFLKRIGKSI